MFNFMKFCDLKALRFSEPQFFPCCKNIVTLKNFSSDKLYHGSALLSQSLLYWAQWLLKIDDAVM